ncbi:MAG: hypothetical protein Q9227_002378 [Pyrenula ochraceoflavens]
MDTASHLLVTSHQLLARVENSTSNGNSTSNSSDPKDSRPPVYKFIGIALAVASGLFIGVSFVLKKTGLLKANAKYNEEAGEGYGYLKNAFWWTGMTLMIVGEICNFVAYAFVDAILVTPLGALSVVVTTILSAIFLKERLSFVGKVGCFNCIIGSVVIVLNAPEQSSVATIQDMQHFVIAPGFLSFAGVIIVGSAFIALWVGPRYGKKNMLVYLSVCSMIGGLSVVATQGLGAAVLAQANGTPQFNQWFLYVLLVFVIATLLTEIIYLNKALNLFNAALVTPTYYVFFTSATIVTSAILFQGFKGTAVTITTVVLGFFVICSGVVLLQLSKSAKDVPDAAVFKGDLDQVREVGEQEQPEYEPKADALRGTAAIIRRFSVSRQKMEEEEAKRLREEKRQEMEPIGEDEVVEWDGLRRRKTLVGQGQTFPVNRRKTIHPPLGMSHFPTEGALPQHHDDQDRDTVHFFENIRSRAQNVFSPGLRKTPQSDQSGEAGHVRSPMHPVPLTEITVNASRDGKRDGDTPIRPYGPGSLEEAQEHIYGLPASLVKEQQNEGPRDGRTIEFADSDTRNRYAAPSKREENLSPGRPPHSSRRQFSFQNVFHRNRNDPEATPRPALTPTRQTSSEQKKAFKTATEEERLGLVKGDSQSMLVDPQRTRSDSSSTASSQDPHHYYDNSYASQSSYHPARTRDPTYQSSEDDSDDDWQMTSPPRTAIPPQLAQLRQSPSRSPPRLDTRQAPPTTRQQQGSASTTSPPSSTSSSGYPQPRVQVVPPEANSPDEERQRQQRRDRGDSEARYYASRERFGGGNGGGSGGAFI